MVGRARGASLVGVLVLVVALGALTAMAVIGVNAMTGNDSATSGLPITSTTAVPRGALSQGAIAACRANADAAKAASAAYFANSGRTYPAQWSDLTASSAPTLTLAEHVVINASNPVELDGNGWKLIMSRGGATAPTFVCKYAR